MNLRNIKSYEDLKELKPKTFGEAIKLKCLDCSGYELSEVKKCSITSCPLYNFRGGHRLKNTD